MSFTSDVCKSLFIYLIIYLHLQLKLQTLVRNPHVKFFNNSEGMTLLPILKSFVLTSSVGAGDAAHSLPNFWAKL